MMQTLTVRDLARVLVAARVELLSAETTLNALNVFPVPDGDTGTNMRQTLEAGLTALDDVDGPEDERAGLRGVVAAMTRGAQGNSGVILSEYVRGFVREITTWKHLTRGPRGLQFSGDALAWALAGAAAAARGAVHEPVDGTILSVADQAARASGHLADAAEHAGARVGAGAIAQAAFDAAREALERTPEQLEVLAHSNVIDAGAAGLVLVLESLARVAGGRHGLPLVSARSWLQPRQRGSLAEVGGCHASAGGPAFEVITIVEGMDDDTAASLRQALSRVGDSLAVAGGDGVHRVHLHTDQVLVAVSRMRELGRTGQVRVTRFEGPLASLTDVVVVSRDEAVRAHARALGAQVQSPGERSAENAVVLSDDAEPQEAQTHQLLGLLRALDERVAAAAWDHVAPVATGTHAQELDPSDEVAAFDGDGDDEFDGEVEVLRSDSWRAARDLARLHLAGAESVLICVDPDAARDDCLHLLGLVGELAPHAEVEVLRLSAGALVLMEVIHG